MAILELQSTLSQEGPAPKKCREPVEIKLVDQQEVDLG